jgi:hypothetical protein
LAENMDLTPSLWSLQFSVNDRANLTIRPGKGTLLRTP